MRSRLLALLSLIAVLSLSAGVVLAQDYEVLAPIEGYVESTTNATDYIRGIYRFAFWGAAVLAVVMVVWGGVQYAGSESVTSKEARKKQIMAAVGGLILALGSYLLLQTINPDLVNFNVNIGEIGVKVDEKVAGPTVPPPPLGKPACLDCVQLSGVRVSQFACDPPRSSCSIYINKTLTEQTQALDTLLQVQGMNMQVTEGYPPTVGHINTCHDNGTCIDYNFSIGNGTPSQVKSVVDTAASVGLKAVYEIPDGTGAAAQCQIFRRAGIPKENVVVVKGISRTHFSVYSPGLSDGSGTLCP